MKRSSSSPPTPLSNSDNEAEDPQVPSSPSKKAKKSPAKPKSPSASPTKKSAVIATSSKAKLVAMALKAVKGMSKAEVEAETGLNTSQVNQMLRADGGGSLYNALIRAAEDMYELEISYDDESI